MRPFERPMTSVWKNCSAPKTTIPKTWNRAKAMMPRLNAGLILTVGWGLRLWTGTGPGCERGRAEVARPRSGTRGDDGVDYSLTDRISWNAGGQLVSTLKPLI